MKYEGSIFGPKNLFEGVPYCTLDLLRIFWSRVLLRIWTKISHSKFCKWTKITTGHVINQFRGEKSLLSLVSPNWIPVSHSYMCCSLMCNLRTECCTHACNISIKPRWHSIKPRWNFNFQLDLFKKIQIFN